jgi:hypothetical protein
MLLGFRAEVRWNHTVTPRNKSDNPATHGTTCDEALLAPLSGLPSSKIKIGRTRGASSSMISRISSTGRSPPPEKALRGQLRRRLLLGHFIWGLFPARFDSVLSRRCRLCDNNPEPRLFSGRRSCLAHRNNFHSPQSVLR